MDFNVLGQATELARTGERPARQFRRRASDRRRDSDDAADRTVDFISFRSLPAPVAEHAEHHPLAEAEIASVQRLLGFTHAGARSAATSAYGGAAGLAVQEQPTEDDDAVSADDSPVLEWRAG